MNYLAHLALAKREPDILVGSIMGDFRKHLEDHELPPDVMAGIYQHQHIDRFTDTHQLVIDLKSLFSKQRRRFAPIIIDVTFDHFLSVHWHTFHSDDRVAFIRLCYQVLQEHTGHMPAPMQRMTQFMIMEDWLGGYMTLSGIATTLDRMAARIRFANRFDNAIEEVEANYARMEQVFLEFYPQLLEHTLGLEKS